MRWMKVMSAAPREYEHVLVWDGHVVSMAYLTDEMAPHKLDNWRISYDGDGMWPVVIPTHWKALPSPPKEPTPTPNADGEK